MSDLAVAKRRISRKGKRQNALALFLLGTGLLLFGIVAFLALSGQASSAGEQPATNSPAKVDYPAPELTLQDLQGNRYSLSDFRGKVVLVNHWATWCPPCKEELPELEAYYQVHKDDELVLIGIEAGEPREQVQAFAEGYKLTYPVWLDPDQAGLDAFHTESLPSTFVIDVEGNVRLAWAGAITRATLEKYVTPMLEVPKER